jgi:hypothetical protein
MKELLDFVLGELSEHAPATSTLHAHSHRRASSAGPESFARSITIITPGGPPRTGSRLDHRGFQARPLPALVMPTI